jgi:threonine aldolase
MTDEQSEIRMARRACTRYLSHHYPRTPAQELRELAELAPDYHDADQYGVGELIDDFEARMAALLGKEAALFVPSGTMAQQLALRVHADRRVAGQRTVVMHPRNHLDRSELYAYQHLHQLRAIYAGGVDQLLTLDDLNTIAQPCAALLLELPQRELGGQLPAWDDLVAQTQWASARGAARHMDGARLWETGPFYARVYADIAALFDTVYVSCYKILGGIAGAALAGPADVIAEARVWQKRHGGTLIRAYPYILAAQRGLDERLPRVPAYCAKARELAAALTTLPGVRVLPDPPQTNMFHLYLPAPHTRVMLAALEIARAHGVWLASSVAPTALPGLSRLEVTAGDATLDLTAAEVVDLFGELLERANA